MRKRKIFIFVTMLLLVFNLVVNVSYAKGENDKKEKTVNFVLVMDESSTMKTSDRYGYCQSAISMFVDLLPVENANVGVIGFGHSDSSTAYSFSKELVPSIPGHSNYTRVISEMASMANKAAKDGLKNDVNTLSWNGSQTLIDAGLLAGIDMLSVNNTNSGEGCVIMLTDGEYRAFAETGRDDKTDMAKAVEYANSHSWPIYCMELDYANSASAIESSHRYLTSMITDQCDGETYKVTTSNEVATAFMEIINNFYETGEMGTGTTDENGYGEYTFDVPELTSETNVTITSSSIKGAKLFKGDTEITIGDYDNDGLDETNYNTNDFIVNQGKIYCNIKMIVPEAGKWTIRVRADANTIYTVNNIAFSDLKISSVINPADTTKETALTKKDKILADVALTYNGKNIRKESLGEAKAYMCVENMDTGDVMPKKELEWDESTNQFKGVLDVVDIGRSGHLSVWTEVTYGYGDIKISDKVNVYTYNEPVSVVDGAKISGSGYVRTTLKESIEGMIHNPDSDEVYFKIDCDNRDGDATVELSDDKSALEINTGTHAGTYNGTLYVWDADMGEERAEMLPIYLEVLNHTMKMKNIPDQDMTEILANQVDIRKKVKNTETLSIAIDLNEYFSDEDQGDDISYKVSVSDKELLTLNEQKGILTISSNGDGIGEITVLATDDDGSEFVQTFQVKTATKESILAQIRKKMLEKYVGIGIVAAIVMGIILIVSVIIKGRTKIRGNWRITFEYGGDYSEIELDIANDVPRSQRHKTTLWNLIEDYLYATKPSQNAALNQSEKLKNILISGVVSGAGCKLKNKNKDTKLKEGYNRTEIRTGRTIKITAANSEAMLIFEDLTNGNDFVVTLRIH